MTVVEPTDTAQAALAAEVARMRDLLEAHCGAATTRARPGAERSAAVDRLTRVLGLSRFERDVLVLCIAVELDGRVGELVGALQDGEPRPSFALALSLLGHPHWDALAPASPLRQWRIVELQSGATLATSPLRVDEHVLHHLTGLPAVDPQLAGIAHLGGRPLPAPAQDELASETAAAVGALEGAALVVLEGDDHDGGRAVAAAIASGLGRRSLVVTGDSLPAPGPALATVAVRVDRDALLLHAVPIIDVGDSRSSSAAALVPLLRAPVVVTVGDTGGHDRGGRVALLRTVTLPTAPEQRALWGSSLGDASASLSRVIEELAEHHRFSAATVHAVATELRAAGSIDDDGLRRACRAHGRRALDGLAARIEPSASWDDLVLPDGPAALVRSIAEHLRHRTQVYERWGFRDGSGRGLGLTALFAGESGTGKTLAAEVVAGSAGLDLYRVDLSAVVSKYIGETEKNLSRLFDAAESAGAVLLFDEADALFGKRSEVKDSHDRYANLEIAYLLQRMEAYRGLAILTTNLRSNIDRAFTRRLRFIVQFPFPSEAERERIWRRCLPATAPVDELDPVRLAALNISGGTIRALALGAAFAAAEDGGPITTGHVLRAAEIEYAKAERTLTSTERSALVT